MGILYGGGTSLFGTIKFGHVSSSSGSFIIRSMGFHGRSGSFAKEEEGSIFGPPVHKFDNGEVYRAKTINDNSYIYDV